MKIRIYGDRDDIIEIEGDYEDEVSALKSTWLLFADGSVIVGDYTDEGIWRFDIVKSGSATIVHVPYDEKAREENDDSDAYDLLTLEGDDVSLLWHGSDTPPPDVDIGTLTKAAKIVTALKDKNLLSDWNESGEALEVIVRAMEET